MTKHILCLARSDIPDFWLGSRNATKMTETSFFQSLEKSSLYWLPRPDAEKNPDYKQLIPYVLLQDTQGAQLGAYRRAGREARLHDFWSLGIGGHVEPVNERISLPEILSKNMHREIDEEISVLPSFTGPVFQGVINEEETEVGTVHLGLVHLLTVHDAHTLLPGDELVDFRWVERGKAEELNLELWSRLALELVEARR
jgi:predicted NUDIX family phosphoesterase